MRALILAGLLALSAPAHALAADDGDVRRVLTEAGLVGRWAIDCDARPSGPNGWETIGWTSDDGPVTSFEDHAEWSSTYTIIEARRLSETDTEVTEIWARDGTTSRAVYRRQGDRQTIWWADNSEGEPLIREGRLVDDDSENKWFNRCADTP